MLEPFEKNGLANEILVYPWSNLTKHMIIFGSPIFSCLLPWRWLTWPNTSCRSSRNCCLGGILCGMVLKDARTSGKSSGATILPTMSSSTIPRTFPMLYLYASMVTREECWERAPLLSTVGNLFGAYRVKFETLRRNLVWRNDRCKSMTRDTWGKRVLSVCSPKNAMMLMPALFIRGA